MSQVFDDALFTQESKDKHKRCSQKRRSKVGRQNTNDFQDVALAEKLLSHIAVAAGANLVASSLAEIANAIGTGLNLVFGAGREE